MVRTIQSKEIINAGIMVQGLEIFDGKDPHRMMSVRVAQKRYKI